MHKIGPFGIQTLVQTDIQYANRKQMEKETERILEGSSILEGKGSFTKCRGNNSFSYKVFRQVVWQRNIKITGLDCTGIELLALQKERPSLFSGITGGTQGSIKRGDSRDRTTP